MASLIVGGVTVSVANDGAQETSDFIGDRTRMQDGSMRVMVVAQKRQWKITTILIADATAATLRAALQTTSLPVACSGDLLGGSVNCIPEITAYMPVNKRGTIMRRVAFTLYEA